MTCTKRSAIAARKTAIFHWVLPNLKIEMECTIFKKIVRLKLVTAIFHFFIKRQLVKNYKKCFLFHLKSSFLSWDILIFVFPSSHLVLLFGHCFRGWLKTNLKVYDFICCLNKNLIMHFVWYLEKEKKVWHWNFVHRWSIR